MNTSHSRLARLCRMIPALLLAAAGAGCADLAGVGGGSHYGCKAPEGVQCDSVAGNYSNSVHNNLPWQRAGAAPGDERRDGARGGAAGAMAAQAGGEPGGFAPASLRVNARVLRLWIKPWEDADRDLVDQSYVYLQVDRGGWLVDHVQARAREPFAPVRAPEPPDSGAEAARPAPGAADQAAAPDSAPAPAQPAAAAPSTPASGPAASEPGASR